MLFDLNTLNSRSVPQRVLGLLQWAAIADGYFNLNLNKARRRQVSLGKLIKN